MKHPLVKHKLGLMVSMTSARSVCAKAEVGSLLTYKRPDLETERVTIEGWNGPVQLSRSKVKLPWCQSCVRVWA
ncbi:MAG: hypothetical protein ACLTXH_05460 [Enterobacter hormaechei]